MASIDIRWKASFSASCIHTITCMRAGLPVVDSELATLLVEPAEALFYELQQACGSVERPLCHLQALASAYENNRELAEVTITKLHGRAAVTGTNVSRLAGSLAD